MCSNPTSRNSAGRTTPETSKTTTQFGSRTEAGDSTTPRTAHEFCWRVPQAGRGNAFWIPLRINPAQRELWGDLLDGDVSVGEFRLQEHRTTWVLHVTVEYAVADPDVPDDPTPVGFDIGEANLLTGCALQDDTPTQPMLFDGGRARHLRKEMFTTLRRLQERDADWRIDERFDYYQNALTDIVETATRQAVEYAQRFENPVIVLEDLSYIRESMDYGKYMNRRLHSWAFARLAGRIEDKAREEGIPVRFVNPAYTSQTCHECGHVGQRNTQATFRCPNDDCWVSEYHGDINASVNIATRFDRWGERCALKPDTDDSPRDGSACDSTTGHRTPSPKPGQMTRAEPSS